MMNNGHEEWCAWNTKGFGNTRPWCNCKSAEPEPEKPLTKRETFAMAAMQGMLACGASKYQATGKGFMDSVISESTKYADELLKALEADK